MSAPWIPYLTRPGDRWDLVAWRMYGDAMDFEVIIAANPHVPIVPVLDGGILLRIPIRATAELDDLALPPWKRAGVTTLEDTAIPPWKRP